MIFSFINQNTRQLNLTFIAKNIEAFGALAPLLMVFQEWLCWLKKGIFGHFCEKVVNYLDIFWTYISFQSINSELNQLHIYSLRATKAATDGLIQVMGLHSWEAEEQTGVDKWVGMYESLNIF